MGKTSDSAQNLLKTYQVPGTPLFVLGTFDTGVTVLSQQIRALNFAWAIIETEYVRAGQSSVAKPARIAIVGGGFAGLSAAAGLVVKHANATISVFEQRDALLPLQQGSDSRWLHPRIYDWPAEGSDGAAALLPVLNWTAARASDVVVQIMSEWTRLLEAHTPQLTLYCNARHLQIRRVDGTKDELRIEWVGEKRNERTGTASTDSETLAVGTSANFDIVVLAVGFGLERDGALSYWRNETLGQPSLDRPRETYLVSGQGDGAMIDLFRLRIAQYRQDRILSELFHQKPGLLTAVRNLYREYIKRPAAINVFAELQTLATDIHLSGEFAEVVSGLRRRLRRDTDVILHLKVTNVADLFDHSTSQISFQNKVLAFLLYSCGGFVPSAQPESALMAQYGISDDRVIRRHGTKREELFDGMLSKELAEAIAQRRGKAKPDPFSQTDKEAWSGGYFGFPGPSKHASALNDDMKEHWRKEYLPGPTSLLAGAFCAALSGAIKCKHPELGRLRVTLHRAVVFGTDELLQQTCDYFGTDDARGATSAAARTFPAQNAVIGLAYRCRRIVRSLIDVERERLNDAMVSLRLTTAARTMWDKVGFVLAIPILEPELPLQFTQPSPVAGVIYVDSAAPGFFIDDEELEQIVSMSQHFIDGLQTGAEMIARMSNLPLSGLGQLVPPRDELQKKVSSSLELVGTVDPPRTDRPFQFNFDFSDFVPVD